jgi:hypothetical protein
MRITDEGGTSHRSIYVALTDDEAAELRDGLDALLREGQGLHWHVADAKFQTELTIYRADDPTVAPPFA